MGKKELKKDIIRLNETDKRILLSYSNFCINENEVVNEEKKIDEQCLKT